MLLNLDYEEIKKRSGTRGLATRADRRAGLVRVAWLWTVVAVAAGTGPTCGLEARAGTAAAGTTGS